MSSASERGHEVYAPAWPGIDGDIDDLRRDPSRGRVHFTIGQEGWEEVADYALYRAFEQAREATPAAG